MPSGRLRIGEAEKREKFMEEIFQKDPTMSAAKANDEFMKHFGSRMRNNAVYAIRAKVRALAQAHLPKVDVVMVEQPRARRSYEELTEKPAFLVTGSSKQVKFLNDTLEMLRSKGLSDLKVDHVADSYAVITKA